MVLFIYRPEYYGLQEDENHASTKGVATVSIAKHRNGKLGDIDLRFVGQYARFEDLEQDFINGYQGSNATPDGGGIGDTKQFAPNTAFGNNISEGSVKRIGSKMNSESPKDIPF